MMAVVRIVKYLKHCLAQVRCVMIDVLKPPFLWPSSDCAAVLLSGFLLVLQAWPPPSPAWYPLVCLLATSNPLGAGVHPLIIASQELLQVCTSWTSWYVSRLTQIL